MLPSMPALCAAISNPASLTRQPPIPMRTPHPPTRSQRLASAVTHLTRLYCARRRAGRPVAWLVVRSNKLSAAYLLAREADYARPL